MDGMPFFNHRFILAFFLVNKFLCKWTNPLAFIQKFPLTMANPPPTALVRQFSASSAAPQKKVPSLQYCFLSDGCVDVQKFLQRQVAARKCSLWRTSTALNLIHGVSESLFFVQKHMLMLQRV
jgi:hypothetical protein